MKDTNKTQGANKGANTKVVEGITSLTDKALAVIQSSLNSPDEQIRLKAACWVTDKVESYGAKLAKLKETAVDTSDWSGEPLLDVAKFTESAQDNGLQSYL